MSRLELQLRPVVVGRLFFFRGRSKRAKAARWSTATVSSLMMDVAWGVAGLAVPLVGLAADRVGLQATLTGMALLSCWALCSLPPSAPTAVVAADPSGDITHFRSDLTD